MSKDSALLTAATHMLEVLEQLEIYNFRPDSAEKGEAIRQKARDAMAEARAAMKVVP